MNVLVCVKRVPATAGKITLTADEQAIDTRYLGFTVSPHEECAVEEAVRIVEAHGGSSTVLTLGPGGGDRPAARGDGGRHRSRDPAADRRRGVGSRGDRRGDRRRDPGARGRRRPVRPHPARQRGGRHRRLPGRRAGRRRPRPAGRVGRQGPGGPRRDRECPARGARWRLGGLRDPATGGRDRQGRDQPAALPVGAGPSARAQEGDRDRSRWIRRPLRRPGSGCACRSSRRVPSRSWARVPRPRRGSSRCFGAWG